MNILGCRGSEGFVAAEHHPAAAMRGTDG